MKLCAARAIAPRDPVAGIITRRVDLDVLGVGDGEARKALPDWDLDPSLLCAFFVGSTVLSIPSSNGRGRGISRAVPPESSCVTSRTGTNAPFPWTASGICTACLSRNCGAAGGCLFVKKRSGRPPLAVDIDIDIDDGLAGRFVAERASRVGTMGRFPVMMRASRKARRLIVAGAERPVPKRSGGSVEIALRIRTSTAASPRLSLVMSVASVILTLSTFDCEPSRPYHVPYQG